MLSRTLCQLSDLFVLFCRPTVPHAAAFILPSLGRQSACRRPCAILRQTAIGQKTRPSTPGSTFRAGSLQSVCRLDGCTNARRVSLDRRKLGCGSCGGCARCLQNGRRKAASRRVSVGRGNVRCCGSGLSSGHGNIDANDPLQTFPPRKMATSRSHSITGQALFVGAVPNFSCAPWRFPSPQYIR
jgi:hypothetical protein